jgi:hypothetical protein
MQPVLLPLRGGSIEALAPFLNLASENDFVLVVAWLLGALHAGGPYPVLAIAGEQGLADFEIVPGEGEKVLRQGSSSNVGDLSWKSL